MNTVLTPEQQDQLLNPKRGLPGEMQADDQPLPPPPGYTEETIAPLPKEQVHDQIHMDYTDSPVTPSFREALNNAPVNDADAAADQLIQAAAETPTMADEVQDAIDQQETAAIMEQVAPQDPMTQSPEEGWGVLVKNAAQQMLGQMEESSESPAFIQQAALEDAQQPVEDQPAVEIPVPQQTNAPSMAEDMQQEVEQTPVEDLGAKPLVIEMATDPIKADTPAPTPEPTPVQEETVKPEPAPQQVTDYTVGVSDVAVRQLDERVKIGDRIVRVKRAVNRTLGYFIVGWLRNGVIDDTLKIQGSFLKGTNTEGIWEEGGANNVEGHILLPVDPTGEPLCPATVSYNKEEVNGTHALFPVWIGCYLILGGHSQGRNILAVYQIKESIHDKETMTYPKFRCELIGTVMNGRWKKDDRAPETFWSADHPAIKAAQERIFEMYATTPCYATAWRTHGFNKNDFKSMLSDQEFMAKKQDFKTLPELYEKVNDIVGHKLNEHTPGKSPCCITVLQYFPSKDVVGVFCFGVLYTFQDRRSDGGRFFYGRTFLRPKDVFWYIERKPETAIPFADLKMKLKDTNGPMASIVRRMVPLK